MEHMFFHGGLCVASNQTLMILIWHLGLSLAKISLIKWEHKLAIRLYGICLDAWLAVGQKRGSPVVIDREPRSKTAQQASTRRRRSSKELRRLTRRVYVDGKIQLIARDRHADGVETGTKRERDDLRKSRLVVRGFIRRQRYGPNNSLQKLVYVQSYESPQMGCPKTLRIDVASH